MVLLRKRSITFLEPQQCWEDLGKTIKLRYSRFSKWNGIIFTITFKWNEWNWRNVARSSKLERYIENERSKEETW